MGKCYAGVGSRKTPIDIQGMMTGFAELAASLQWTLRSGHAEGADQAFEDGVPNKEPYKKEIYLPWGGFNGSDSIFSHPSDLAIEMAQKLLGEAHWENLSAGGQKLHARNIHQVLGKTLNDPVKFLICWTPDGKDQGGTATALRVARMYHVPVFNMATLTEDEEKKLEDILYGR